MEINKLRNVTMYLILNMYFVYYVITEIYTIS